VAGAVARGGRTTFEVADVVRAYGAQFVRTHPTSRAQRRVLRAIARCRTAALGGHREVCDDCGHPRITYNSCRNRHCPKCQGAQRAKWLAAEQALLLPVPYFHVIFTLSHRLNPLLRTNPRRLYALLFQSAAATLQHCARRRGVQLGITMVLHTWGQTLTEHVHVHCVVTGGGLALDGTRWKSLVRAGRQPFLFPVRALSHRFRRTYMAGLERLRTCQQLVFVGDSTPLAQTAQWEELTAALQHVKWVVYAQPPFGGPEQVLKYLSRYTHRVAIANQRLLAVANGVVRFEYHDYADPDVRKELPLPATEFLRRFLLHVVPKGFMRIRHYGITANRQRQQKLARCRELLGTTPAPPPATPLPAGADTAAATPEDTTPRCPQCGASLRIVEILPPQPHDTS
jgi:ribosomal protein S18